MKKIILMLLCLVPILGIACNKVTTTMKVPTIDALTLGKDYKDLEASIKFLTHRTDLLDTKLKGYVAEFNKLYPKITVTYEGVTKYSEDVTIRLTTDQWGDICMIPTTDKKELPNLFVPFGDKTKLDKSYNFLNNFSYNNVVYGIPSTANAQGIVYNKAVFRKAGITAVPKTPTAFIAALQKIKDLGKVIPLYTNFGAGWTMGAWDAYIGGSATGDADFMNKISHLKDPFAERSDETGPYAVYSVLYDAVAKKLIEDDPTTTDWEGSKGMLNRGEIGCMVLGSWAVVQMKQAGPNPDDVAYMPFPISVNGKQFASAGPDYNYGINAKASDKNKIASLIYVKWLTEVSQFAYSEGGIPIFKTEKYPDLYQDFAGIEFVVDNAAPAGEETLFNDLNNKSEVGINKESAHVQNILESAFTGKKTLDAIVSEWNAKWTKAQTDLDVKITN